MSSAAKHLPAPMDHLNCIGKNDAWAGTQERPASPPGTGTEVDSSLPYISFGCGLDTQAGDAGVMMLVCRICIAAE
jgi:hypothetical protein